MEQELRTIFEAQILDTQIIKHEREMINAPKMIEAMDREISGLKEKIAKEKEIVEELEKERRKREKELDVEREKIKRHESKLYEVKTNKEYQALLKEIETTKEGNDKIEEEALVLMEKAEELRKDFESSGVLLKKREKEVEIEKTRLNSEINSIGKIVVELKEQRDNLLSVVNGNLKATYKTLIEKRGGIAVVNLKNGVCMGCYMNIPPQQFIEATKNTRLMLCPSCNRIFFFLEEDEE